MWENPIKMEMPKTKDTLATWRQANFAVQPDKRVNRMVYETFNSISSDLKGGRLNNYPFG
jgi:hypothetical protein